jgi:hypothetical protein
MKKCTVCKIEKDFSEFAKHKCAKDGLHSDCRSCAAEYRKRNREKRRLYNIEYTKRKGEEWKEKVRAYREKNRADFNRRAREYHKKNRDKIQERHRLKLETDPLYKLKRKFYHFIKDSFRRNRFPKTGENRKIIGCDYDFFINYIESQFKDGMNWDNIHIDHIKPLKTAKTIEEVANLCHYTNLQPLLIADNIKKKDKLIEKQLRLL